MISPSTDGADSPDTVERRNPGAPFLRDWALRAAPRAEEVARAVEGLPARAAASGEPEAALLIRAARAIDLTTLSGDDTPARVRELCGRARRPFAHDVRRTGPDSSPLTAAAVCVYHHFVHDAREALAGSGVRVAVVSAGFPAGLSPLRQRVEEVRASAEAGADEIDAVINRCHALEGLWGALYQEVRAFRDACGRARLKVILGTGDLADLRTVAIASRVCLLAGADFIKTSTGKETVNAAYPEGLVMLRAIADYRSMTGHAAGFKPAGGIRTPVQAREWLRLTEEVLGEGACEPGRFRIGASGLLGAIGERLRAIATPPDAEHGDRAAPRSEPPAAY